MCLLLQSVMLDGDLRGIKLKCKINFFINIISHYSGKCGGVNVWVLKAKGSESSNFYINIQKLLLKSNLAGKRQCCVIAGHKCRQGRGSCYETVTERLTQGLLVTSQAHGQCQKPMKSFQK